MTVMIYRDKSTVDVFIQSDTASAKALFGEFPGGLVSDDKKIDFDYLSVRNWEIAQDLWRHASLKVGAETPEVEATSFLLHTVDDPLAFATPFQAMTAIAACTVPLPNRPTDLQDMAAYMGFIAFTDNPSAPVTVSFDKAARRDMQISVLDYTGDTLNQKQQLTVHAGQRVTFHTSVAPSAPKEPMVLAVLTSLSALLFTITLMRWRKRPVPAT